MFGVGWQAADEAEAREVVGELVTVQVRGWFEVRLMSPAVEPHTAK